MICGCGERCQGLSACKMLGPSGLICPRCGGPSERDIIDVSTATDPHGTVPGLSRCLADCQPTAAATLCALPCPVPHDLTSMIQHGCTEDAGHEARPHYCKCGKEWRTPRKRINSQRKGKEYEQRLARYLVEQGWPDAKRSVRSGWSNSRSESQDEGDITGTPGLCFQLKAGDVELVPGAGLDRIYRETVAQARDRLPLIVNRRVGVADPGGWFAWLSSASYASVVLGVPGWLAQAVGDDDGGGYFVRVQLGDIVTRLREMTL